MYALHMSYKPLQFAAWLAVAGISFGLALSWGWLVLAGIALPILVLAAAVVLPFFK